MSSSSHHGFCWLMPQSGRPSTTARLTLPVPECCSHSVSPRNTPAFLSLTAGWRSLVALSSPLQRVCRLLRRLSAFLRHRRSYALTWWSKDGVYHRGRTQQVIKVHMWQSVAGSSKHSTLKACNKTNTYYKLYFCCVATDQWNITYQYHKYHHPSSNFATLAKKTVSDFVIFMETCCDRVSKSIRNVLDTIKTLSEDECYGCAGNTGDGDVWDPNKETAG